MRASTTTPTTTGFSTPTATGPSVPFQTIHMFDAHTGWAVTSEQRGQQGSILHTTMGVTHWHNVTPVFESSLATIEGTAFFDPLTAWVAVGLLIYRTQDEGQTWQKASLPRQVAVSLGPFAMVGQLFFLNAHLGWALVGPVAFAGSEAVDILGTSDGGASWKVLSVCGPTTLNTPAALPFAGGKTGLGFVNEMTGWVSGAWTGSPIVWLYVTHDGGVSWQHQSLPVPADATETVTLPPVFFTLTEGLLPAVVPRPQGSRVVVYVTQDAGASWKATTPVPASAAGPEMITFVDALHGCIASNTSAATNEQDLGSTVYSTSNGAEHWTAHDVTLSSDIALIDFASPTLGWAIDGLGWLYQTTDGGQTWRKVMPSVT